MNSTYCAQVTGCASISKAGTCTGSWPRSMSRAKLASSDQPRVQRVAGSSSGGGPRSRPAAAGPAGCRWSGRWSPVPRPAGPRGTGPCGRSRARRPPPGCAPAVPAWSPGCPAGRRARLPHPAAAAASAARAAPGEVEPLVRLRVHRSQAHAIRRTARAPLQDCGRSSIPPARPRGRPATAGHRVGGRRHPQVLAQALLQAGQAAACSCARPSASDRCSRLARRMAGVSMAEVTDMKKKGRPPGTNTDATASPASRCCQVGPGPISRIAGLSSYST